MVDLTDLLKGPRQCPHCGAANVRAASYCGACGERIRNTNPVLRLLMTVAAVGVVIGVIWWKLHS